LRSHMLVPALVWSLALPPAPVFAEPAADSLSNDRIETVLRRGDVVRISYQDTKPRTVWGEVKDLDPGSVTLKTYEADATVPLHRITRIERRVGSHGNFGPAASLGGILGGLLGAGLVAVTSKSELGYVPGNDVATGFFFGAGAGILIGGIMGETVLRTDDWREVPSSGWGR
jgi:hypothetical protein